MPASPMVTIVSNVVDTPGHADFGEVERVLRWLMVFVRMPMTVYLRKHVSFYERR